MRFPSFPAEPGELAARLLAADQRVLLFGAAGSGKSTLAVALAAELARRGRRLLAVTADPGSPAFGAPGAVAAAEWRTEGWRLLALEALCSLDAARFRLPLITAVRRLMRRLPTGPLVVDTPGLVRGGAAAELLQGLVEATAVDAVVVLVPAAKAVPLAAELAALDVEVGQLEAAAEARELSKLERAQRRTHLWDEYLRTARSRELDLGRLRRLGLATADTAVPWLGRQVALMIAGRTLAMGEVTAHSGDRITLRAPPTGGVADALLARDAGRDAQGLLRTSRPAPQPSGGSAVATAPAPEGDPGQGLRIGNTTARLVNGVLGDPLLLLRLINQRRALLFDLGDMSRLGATVVHQITDVFITHAHIDHIAGFLWLLRARIGDFPPCRLYGPPGLSAHIDGMVNGVLWDRIGGNGPIFEVTELHGEALLRFRIQAGRGCTEQEASSAIAGTVLDEPAFRVRAAALDHGFGTTTLAYAFEPGMQLNVRNERLEARGLAPGPWLGELKRRVLAGDEAAPVQLPNGELVPVCALAEALLLRMPGAKVAYATDFADSSSNRARLIELARGANTFFCEASFVVSDRAQATRTGHLTTRACGEIAAAAGVQRLVPFHFSHRYESDVLPAYRQVEAVFGRVLRAPEFRVGD